MNKQQSMEVELGYWVDELGYAEVVRALLATCNDWATTGDVPPIQCDGAHWGKRERALDHALRETEDL